MSVINQLLLDLEKRHASGAERSALPNHVRALPEEERRAPWGWIAAGCGVAAVMVASWALLSGVDWSRRADAAARTPQRATEPVVGKVGKAPAATAADAGKSDTATDPPASRLSFELSNPPRSADTVDSSPAAALPAERIVGNPAVADAAPKGPPPGPVEQRREPVKLAAVASVKPPPAASPAAPAAKSEIQKQVRQLTPREQAENEYSKATVSLHQGRQAEAQEGFQATLALYPAHHAARQAWVGLLVDARRFGDAERVLQEGLALAPAQTGFAMTLARLQHDRGDTAQAIATLQKGVDHAQANADYLAFLAALLQRHNRHEEAVAQYQSALRLRPAAGVWWLGVGMSLQAMNRASEAQEAYRRARATNSLTPELAAFAEQRIRQLQ